MIKRKHVIGSSRNGNSKETQKLHIRIWLTCSGITVQVLSCTMFHVWHLDFLQR
jgi:hypothetical protein